MKQDLFGVSTEEVEKKSPVFFFCVLLQQLSVTPGVYQTIPNTPAVATVMTFSLSELKRVESFQLAAENSVACNLLH